MLNYKYKTEGFDLWLGWFKKDEDDSYKRIRVRVQLMVISFFRIIADVFIKAVMGYRFEPRVSHLQSLKNGSKECIPNSR